MIHQLILRFSSIMSICCKLIASMLMLLLGFTGNADAIIGGREAAKHSRPHMVLLECQRWGTGKNSTCGGFLIKRNYVITAAHCKADSYKVYLGIHDHNDRDGVQTLSVAQEFLPKGAGYGRDDIMLLKLNESPEFNGTLRTIKLPSRVKASRPRSCWIAGWGSNGTSTQMSVKLKEVNVTLLKNPMCDRIGMYCSAGEAGPAGGDSGGPLVCENGKAYGVVSASYRPFNSTRPFYMYTKIDLHRQWITNITT